MGVARRYDEPTDEIGPERGADAQAVEAPMLTSGGRFGDGRYLLDRALGRGGMAAVWLARDRRLARPVAIKVLSDTLAGDSAYLARFRREARIAARLTHPNLIRIYDYGTERGRPFLVMEYVGGGDLAQRLSDGDPPDPDRLARELLGALRHIHAADVLHRDVKPHNVLIGRDGRVRLTDFGIAQPADATSLTQTGLVLGTARYLAPEVLEGEPPSERSDLYSLGVVLAEVTAQRPGSAVLSDLIAALRAEDPAARPALAAKALAKLARPARIAAEPRSPGARSPATASTAARERSLASEVRDRVERARRDPRRSLAIAGIAAVLAAVFAIGVIASGGGDPEPGGQVAADQRPEAGPEGDGRGDGAEDGGGGAPEPAAADGAALNDRGFALVNEGRPGEAVPILRRAVEALEGSGDITYAYALFNLGRALRLAGHPEDAIPILEARLEIPNQRGVVRRELEAARADAGQDDERRGRGRDRGRSDDDDD